MINAPISKEDLTAVAVAVQRVLNTPKDVADESLQRSVMIFNSALEEHPRDTSGKLAPAIILEPTASTAKKRMLASDSIQSPSKRLRGRPPRAAIVGWPIRQSSPSIPSSGRLKRPTQIPIRASGRIAKARTAEEVYEVPEDSPSKPTKSSVTIHENSNATQESQEDTATDHSRRVVVKSTTEKKEANRTTSVLPKKRGRPPKSSTKPLLHNGEKNTSALTHAHVPQSGSAPQPSNEPTKSASTMGKENGLTKGVNGRLQGKGRHRTEDSSITGRSASTELAMEREWVGPGTSSAQASKVSTEQDPPLCEEAEGSRTEDQEGSSNDDDPDYVCEQSGEIEDNIEEQSNRVELQEDVNNVPDEGGRLNDRDQPTVGATHEREAGRAALALEIFDANERWKHVLRAARSVGLKKGRSVSSKRRVGHNIPLLSKPITKFMEKVKEVSLCYQQADPIEITDTASQHDLRSRLHDYTLWLKSAIENIQDSKDASENVGRIQDIYVHAVPQMVFLLKNALNAQAKLYSANEEKQSLKHVLGVQALVIKLCRKVVFFSESAKEKGQVLPITDLPIKGAISRRILPYLRDIRDIVDTELNSIREEMRRAREESERLQMYHAREVKWLEKREKNRVEREQKQRQATEDALRLSARPIAYTNRRYRQTSVELDQWTEEQDHELLRLLWDLGDLPGMDFCSTCSYMCLCLHLRKLNGAILSYSTLLFSKISCRNISGGEPLC